MKIYYITFRSVTFAQRGEQLLMGRGYRCTLQRTPRWMEAQGCGYALRIWAKDVTQAAELLKEHKIPLRRIYIQIGDGHLEELEL